MRKLSLIFVVLSIANVLNSQTLTLDDCRTKAREHYPLIKQFGLIDQSVQYNLNNANKAYLPQLSLSARATYQSEVTKLPITIPNITIPELSKDQYQAAAELTQVIWDGGAVVAQKKISRAGGEVEKQKLEVDLYAVNERIIQLYFGVLLLDEQLKQTKILQDELATNYQRVMVYKQNGVANQADADALKVEQLNALQREIELKSTRKGYMDMLGAMIGENLGEGAVLEKPASIIPVANLENRRPELGLFTAQNNFYESQKSLLSASVLPKVGLFLQGGVGKPALNMLSNSFSPYYIGGLRFSWTISNFYTQKDNKAKWDISQKTSDVQKETFLFNTELKSKQQQTEIEKLQQVIVNDDEIIRLRENIKKAASAKVENGTMTITDLIREINAENQSRQLKSLHEIQLLMSIYQLKNNINN